MEQSTPGSSPPLRRLAVATWSSMASIAARPYVAGESLEAALGVCARLRSLGLMASPGYWNAGDETPDQVAGAYMKALDALAGTESACLSIKAPALAYDEALLVRVAERARARRVSLHFDSLSLSTADSTFTCLTQAAVAGLTPGCTLPARWSRSRLDVQRAIRFGVPVRIVKGQWEDPSFDGDVGASYLELVSLLAGRAARVGVATHDLPLARLALRRLTSRRTPCELELLHGLPMKPMLRLAREMGVPVRVYVPYGRGWLPYALSKVSENPRILWWLMRDLVRAGARSIL